MVDDCWWSMVDDCWWLMVKANVADVLMVDGKVYTKNLKFLLRF